MGSCEVAIDGIEAQRPTDVSRDQRKGRFFFLMNLIQKLCFSQRRGDGSMPPTGDTKVGTEFLTNLKLEDLYNVPDESLEMNSEIFSAMRHGNIEFLEKKVWEKPMACFKNDKGDSILHVAAAYGHVELVKGIVSECPCLLLLTNSKNQVPLHLAAGASHLAVVEALVESVTFFSAQVSTEEEDRERLNVYVLKDENGNTPLLLALKDLLEKQECLSNQQHRPTFPPSRLIKHLQRSTRLMETAARLVDANQDASFLSNNDKISPLYLAVLAGNLTLVNALLKPSGNNVQGLTSTLASQPEEKIPLVHAALKAKHTGVLKFILENYPTLAEIQDDEGRTCLSVGASVGFKEGVSILLDKEKLSVFECDEDGSFPIHIAVEKGHADVVRELLKRFPDSVEQLNRKGQNILHIAAKSRKASVSIMNHIIGLDRKNHLIVEQDVDGNTPLHLATINWRPLKVWHLTTYDSTRTKVLNIRNAEGLRPLDIAETRMQHDYVVRERMTLTVLLGVYKQKAVSCIPTNGMTLESRLKKPDCDQYKDRIHILLLLATLVTTMTFAAGFTMPGGFNSSPPNSGIAILIDQPWLNRFLVFDTVAMYSSVVAILALIWAQLGDDNAHRSFYLALPALFLALCSMSVTFYTGVLATTLPNSSIRSSLSLIFIIFWFYLILLLAPYVILQVSSGIPFIYAFTCPYLYILVWFVKEDDDEKDPTSGSDTNSHAKTMICDESTVEIEFPPLNIKTTLSHEAINKISAKSEHV